MFSVFKLSGLVFLFASVVQDLTRADERGEKETMSCFRVEYGIIWCSKSAKETTEHFVSFLEDIDDETSYKALIDLLVNRKTAKFKKKFLLTCITKCSNAETTKRCSCHEYTYQTQPEILLTNFKSSEDPDPSLKVDLPEALNFLHFGSEENSDVSANQLRVRAPAPVRRRDFDCTPFFGKSPQEIEEAIMRIVQARYERGYYRNGKTPSPTYRGQRPRRNNNRGYYNNDVNPNIRQTNMRIRQVVQEIRNGDVQIVRRNNIKRTNSRVQKKKKSPPPARRLVKEKGLPSVPYYVAPQPQPKKKQKVQKVPKQIPIDDPPPAPRTPQSAAVNKHLLPKNNRVIDMDPNDPKLLDESTPNVVDPEKWSEPVDANDLTQRLLKLQNRQKQGLSLRP